MKISKEAQEEIIKVIKESLRKQLNREPTEKEVAAKLPVFIDNHGESNENT